MNLRQSLFAVVVRFRTRTELARLYEFITSKSEKLDED